MLRRRTFASALQASAHSDDDGATPSLAPLVVIRRLPEHGQPLTLPQRKEAGAGLPPTVEPAYLTSGGMDAGAQADPSERRA